MNDTRELNGTIFELVEVGLAKPAKVNPTLGEKAQEAAATIFHNAPKGEPDWVGMLMQADGSLERHRIREMRELYDQQLKVQAHEQAMASHELKIKEALSAPLRNKQYYEKLQSEQPRVFYSAEAQKQMRQDKKTMGLGFHLKG